MITKKDFEEMLNEIGPPEHDHPEFNGRVPWSMVEKYGTWLRSNDSIAFQVGYNDYCY